MKKSLTIIKLIDNVHTQRKDRQNSTCIEASLRNCYGCDNAFKKKQKKNKNKNTKSIVRLYDGDIDFIIIFAGLQKDIGIYSV